MKLISILVVSLTLLGCYECKDAQCSNVPPVDPVPPDWYPRASEPLVIETDGSEAAAKSPCGRACENLKRIGCPEGESTSNVTCYRACIAMASKSRIPAACWASAKSQEAARACGRGLRCSVP